MNVLNFSPRDGPAVDSVLNLLLFSSSIKTASGKWRRVTIRSYTSSLANTLCFRCDFLGRLDRSSPMPSAPASSFPSM